MPAHCCIPVDAAAQAEELDAEDDDREDEAAWQRMSGARRMPVLGHRSDFGGRIGRLHEPHVHMLCPSVNARRPKCPAQPLTV